MKKSQEHGFTTIHIEGHLLPPEFLQQVAALKASYQANGDYGLSRSLNLKDELGRYWRIALDFWTDTPARISVVQGWLEPLLIQILGYHDLVAQSEPVVLGERRFALSHQAGHGTVPLLLVDRAFDLDKADPSFGDEGRRRSPHGLMQEYLNAATTGCLWGVIANGQRLRLMRNNPSLTRPTCIEFDLEQLFQEQLYADFALLWLLCHDSRLRPRHDQSVHCLLESWRQQAQQTGERALANLRQGVTTALRQLGNGFVQQRDNEALRQAIQHGRLREDALFQQLLRLVYRLLLLFKAEERQLLHHPEADPAHVLLYQQGYALARLRDQALKRRHYDRHTDLWQGLTITFRALGHGSESLALPALGGLFASDQCPDLDTALIDNAHLLTAIYALAFFRSGTTLSRINYRDMGTEELGSVYESLLELHPRLEVHGWPWQFSFVGDAQQEQPGQGSERKLTGSYYTPPALVHELVRSALDPVLEQVLERALRQHPHQAEAALLGIRICDPACGSGHFLLAAARRLAAVLARLQTGSDSHDPSQWQHALRQVVRHCLYGVDKNPLAVELCQTALWIETLEPGKPLTFLDHRIKCGDSLVGATPAALALGIPDAAFDPVTGDDRKVCAALKKRNRLQRESLSGALFRDDELDARLEPGNLTTTMKQLNQLPADTLADVQAQQQHYEGYQNSESYRASRLLADSWCAAFMMRKVDANAPAITEESFQRLRRDAHDLPPALQQRIEALAAQYRFFHWQLEFPEVFQLPTSGQPPDNATMGWCGGFDVLLGNPPWEMLQLDPQEFFSTRDPAVAGAQHMSARDAMIAALRERNPLLYNEYLDNVHQTETVQNFIHGSKRYPSSGFGRLNLAYLFSELFLNLKNINGRAGFIVPSGIATDSFAQHLFNKISAGSLVSLLDFENREAIFAGVHRSYKFALLTLGNQISSTRFTFFAARTEHLLERERQFTLSPEEIKLINPNTRTCPVFRMADEPIPVIVSACRA
ncbi:MAG: N-6 DNA methylase [Magnetococcales bacterium]|nr:N-6 DNA methylase [Magnetococcales bacterium]